MLILKSKLWNWSLDNKSLKKLQCESEKTLMEWFWKVLAWVRLEDLRQISNPGCEIWTHLILGKTKRAIQSYCFKNFPVILFTKYWWFMFFNALQNNMHITQSHVTDTITSKTMGCFKSPRRVSELKPNLMDQNYISICFTKNWILCQVLLLCFAKIKKIQKFRFENCSNICWNWNLKHTCYKYNKSERFIRYKRFLQNITWKCIMLKFQHKVWSISIIKLLLITYAN